MTLSENHDASTAMRLAAYRDELRVLGFTDEQAWALVAYAARDVHGLVNHAEYLARAEPPVPIVFDEDAPDERNEALAKAARDNADLLHGRT